VAPDRLIELYTATKKPEEVKKWRTERAKYPEVAPPRGEEVTVGYDLPPTPTG
jgi:hypothetical protein